VGKEALLFGWQKLQDNQGLQPKQFKVNSNTDHSGYQPTDKEVALLGTLDDQYHRQFQEMMKEYPDSYKGWKQQKVIQTADEWMRICYAESCLTLEDLEPFTKSIEAKEGKRAYAKALVYQDSYLYRTSVRMTLVYHWLRGGITWREDPNEPGKMGLFCPERTPEQGDQPLYPQEITAPFYTEGTPQYQWRQLYNDYCDRVKAYAKESDVEPGGDKRFFKWLKRDDGEENFYHAPGSLPT
jgi:hypothetical protein